MHILSKVFVVFAALLAVLLSALTIAYASNSGRLVTEFRTADARAASATNAMDLLHTQYAAREAALQLQVQNVQDASADLHQQIRMLQDERAQLQSDLQAAVASREALQANISQFQKTVETQTNLLSAFRDELTTLRDSELAFRRQRLELEDRISDLESQNEVLTQTNRQMQETITQMQRTGGSTGAIGQSNRPVNGRVTGVTTEERTRTQLIEISLGTADGVRVGSTIEISRPGQFIADAEVTRVELQSCVATISLAGTRGAQIQQGDTARLRN